MKSLLLFGLFVLIGNQCVAMSQESINTSNSGCYGANGPITMTLSCSAGQVISIETIWLGAKQTSTGCPLLYDAIRFNDTSCCSANPADDCIFAFDHTNYDNYHILCNGQQTCSTRVKRDSSLLGSCDQTLYNAYTTFAYIDYVCVDATAMNPICTPTSANITSHYTYITSDGFPSGMSTSATPCTCSVQTDDPSATLQVVTIQRGFTGNSDASCDQSLSLLDSGQNELVTWTCDNNTNVEHTTNVNGNFVILNLVNDRTEADGTFWVKVKAAGASTNITLSCPAILVKSTTSTTTTTTETTSTTTSMLSTTIIADTSTSITDITSTTTDETYSQTTKSATGASITTTADAASITNASVSSSSVASSTEITISSGIHTTNIPNTTESIDGSLSRRTIIIIGAAAVAAILLTIVTVAVCIRRGKCGSSTRANKNDA